MLFESVLIFLASSLVLIKSASYAVRSVSDIAKRLHFTEFFIAFIIAGFISTFPETFIGINSALAGTPSIGIGALFGSNIADLTIVIAIIALAGRNVAVDSKTIKNNIYFLVATSFPVLFMIDGKLSRDDGIILILIFILYMYSIVKKEKMFTKKIIRQKEEIVKSLVIFLFSMVLLFTSAHFIVESAIDISEKLTVPSIIIGLFMVALGTTLPELTFSLRAVLSRHKEIALGDVLGNVAIDSTFAMGVVAVISPVETAFSVFAMSALFMMFAALLIVTLLQNGKKITWQESFVLLFLYFMFMIVEMRNAIPT